MSDILAPERCVLTSAGVHLRHGLGCTADLTVTPYAGEIVVLACDTILGSVGVGLHPDDAQHFMERLRVAIAVARSLADEAAPTAPIRLSADGDRLLDRRSAS